MRQNGNVRLILISRKAINTYIAFPNSLQLVRQLLAGQTEFDTCGYVTCFRYVPCGTVQSGHKPVEGKYCRHVLPCLSCVLV
jgi:hypothetical protein